MLVMCALSLIKRVFLVRVVFLWLSRGVGMRLSCARRPVVRSALRSGG